MYLKVMKSCWYRALRSLNFTASVSGGDCRRAKYESFYYMISVRVVSCKFRFSDFFFLRQAEQIALQRGKRQSYVEQSAE